MKNEWLGEGREGFGWEKNISKKKKFLENIFEVCYTKPSRPSPVAFQALTVYNGSFAFYSSSSLPIFSYLNKY